jgi:hypothetical protein
MCAYPGAISGSPPHTRRRLPRQNRVQLGSRPAFHEEGADRGHFQTPSSLAGPDVRLLQVGHQRMGMTTIIIGVRRGVSKEVEDYHRLLALGWPACRAYKGLAWRALVKL